MKAAAAALCGRAPLVITLVGLLGLFSLQSHVRDSASRATLAHTRIKLEKRIAQLDTTIDVAAAAVATATAMAAAPAWREPLQQAVATPAAAFVAARPARSPPPVAAVAPRPVPPPPPPAALTSLTPLMGERDFECAGVDEMPNSQGCQVACSAGGDCGSAIAACVKLAAAPSSCMRVAVNSERTWATLKQEGPIDNGFGVLPASGVDASWLSTDFHIAPIADVKWMFTDMCRSTSDTRSLCAHVVDHSYSGACGLTAGGRKPTCAAPMAMHPLSASNGLTFCPNPYALRRSFYDAFKGATGRMAAIDAVICMHPPALCELYMPFNKSIIIYATLNLEMQRENPSRWREWVENVRRIASQPQNAVVTNNEYDAKYIKHFTGIVADVLPSYCGYVLDGVNPNDGLPPTNLHAAAVLLGRNHHNPSNVHVGIRSAAARSPGVSGKAIEFQTFDQAYPSGFSYAALRRHPAIVVLPYTKSTMTTFEVYRLAIPLFTPSVKFIIQLGLLKERVYWTKTPRTKYGGSAAGAASPNDARGADLEAWVALSDTYTMPHITTFDSYDDLIQKLHAADLGAISAKMRQYSLQLKSTLERKWQALIARSVRGGKRVVPSSLTFDDAMKTIYGGGDRPPLPHFHGGVDCTRLSAPDQGRWN